MFKRKKHAFKTVDKIALFLAPILALQWPVLHLTYGHLPVPWEPLLPGLAIFAAAYLLSWAAEVAEVDIPPALALGILALVAVAPEYAVDIYFAWQAGQDPTYIQYATANMTGANRLLVGFGWSFIVLLYAWKYRKKEVKLEKRLTLETGVLLVAALYGLTLALKGSLTVYDTAVFFAIFAFYFYRLLKGGAHEPEAEGPVAVIQAWPTPARWTFVLGFFFLAAWTIWMASHPFAEGILALGRHWGVEEFILVQWLAPLASEAPEFIVASIFALKARPTASFNTIISSTVNQWTLLVGALPLAYVLSKGTLTPMVMDARQIEEVFLTAAQCLFGVVILSNLRFSLKEAAVLFILFITQAFYPMVEPWVGIPSTSLRTAYAGLYVAFALGILVFTHGRWKDFKVLFKVLLKWK